MGRELRRKQAKKEGKSLKQEVTVEENQIKKLVKITLLLVFIICVIYLVSALFITKELDWFGSDAEENTTLVANTILASETFKQTEEEYYVYFYDYKDEDSGISSSVSSKLSSSKVYKVDTSSALNSKYVSDESNKSAKNLNDLKVKAPTVIKVTGETISAYYEGNEILNNLK